MTGAAATGAGAGDGATMPGGGVMTGAAATGAGAGDGATMPGGGAITGTVWPEGGGITGTFKPLDVPEADCPNGAGGTTGTLDGGAESLASSRYPWALSAPLKNSPALTIVIPLHPRYRLYAGLCRYVRTLR